MPGFLFIGKAGEEENNSRHRPGKSKKFVLHKSVNNSIGLRCSGIGFEAHPVLPVVLASGMEAIWNFGSIGTVKYDQKRPTIAELISVLLNRGQGCLTDNATGHGMN